MGGRWVIEVDLAVLSTLSQLREALGHPVILVGGRAVQCRLRLARHDTRVTIDIDVMVASELRPARAALATISASQSDPEHPCRLLGAGLDVDLLANDRDEAQRRDPGQIVDDDGLVLLVPPFADALVCDPELFTLAAGAGRVDVWLPRAGALFASKAANLFLEDRPPAKRASDGHDALSLLDAFGPLALAHDLRLLPAERRRLLAELVQEVGYGGFAAQARLSGAAFPDAQVAIPMLVASLTSSV